MKREILFRGKAVESGEWVYGDLSFHKDGTPFIRAWEGTGDNLHYRSIEVDEDAVGQYTGKSSTDGQKIFEGDIVEVSLWPGSYFLGYVEWRQKDCCFSVRLSKNNSTGVHETQRIVGNIYDNPELMEAKRK